MGKHADIKNKAKGQAAKDWANFKRFGITGIIRTILSMGGAVLLSAITIDGFLSLIYKKDGFILSTGNFFWWEEAGYIIVCIQIFVILFLSLSFLEQGIRKIFKNKRAKNFADESFSLLMDLYDGDGEEVSSKEYIASQIANNQKDYKNSLNTEDFLPTNHKAREFIKGIAILLGIFVVVNGFNLYLMIAGRTIVYDDKIVKTSLLNPVGKAYSYSDIKEYFVEIDDCYPQLKLVTTNNKNFKFSTGGSIDMIGDNLGSYELAMVKVDKILKEHHIKKSYRCKYDDFDDFYTSTKEIKPLFE